MPVGYGGFWLAEGRVLSHPGAGGSIGWADVDSGLAVAFCHNQMGGGGLKTLGVELGPQIGDVPNYAPPQLIKEVSAA
jgi:hypothetical protein